jgi:hypothetical protein
MQDWLDYFVAQQSVICDLPKIIAKTQAPSRTSTIRICGLFTSAFHRDWMNLTMTRMNRMASKAKPGILQVSQTRKGT